MSPVFTLLQDRVNRRDSWRLIARLLKFTTKRVSRLLTKAVTKAVWPTRNRKSKNRTSPTISQIVRCSRMRDWSRSLVFLRRVDGAIPGESPSRCVSYGFEQIVPSHTGRDRAHSAVPEPACAMRFTLSTNPRSRSVDIHRKQEPCRYRSQCQLRFSYGLYPPFLRPSCVTSIPPPPSDMDPCPFSSLIQ